MKTLIIGLALMLTSSLSAITLTVGPAETWADFTTVQAALDSITDSAERTIQLIGLPTDSYEIRVAAHHRIILDFNGITTTQSIYNMGWLTLKDTASGGGIVGADRVIRNESDKMIIESGIYTSTKDSSLCITTWGHMVINGGVITGRGSGIDNGSGGYCEINGGVITGVQYSGIHTSGTLVLNNGLIVAESILESSDCIQLNQSDAVFKMTGGELRANDCRAIEIRYGTVIIEGKDTKITGTLVDGGEWGDITIEGGTFYTQDPSPYVDMTAYRVETNPTGTWQVVDKGPKVTIGGATEEEGVVSGGGIFALGESTTLTATPKDGYTFIGWSGSGIASTNATLVISPTVDMNIKAVFVPTELYADLESGVKEEAFDEVVQKELSLGNVAFEIEKEAQSEKSVITLGLEVKESKDLTNWNTLTNIKAKVEVDLDAKGFYKFTVPKPSLESGAGDSDAGVD